MEFRRCSSSCCPGVVLQARAAAAEGRAFPVACDALLLHLQTTLTQSVEFGFLCTPI